MDQSAHPLPVLPRRAIVLAAIVALHLLLVWALASGLASTAVRAVVTPMSGDIYPNPVPDERPPPAPDPKFVQPTIDPGPAPDVPFEPDMDGGGTSLTFPPTSTPGEPAAPLLVAPPIVLVGKHRLPNTEEYYPASPRRLGIEGAANVRVCVDESGKLQAAPVVEQSSGNAQLDQAAIDVTRDGRYARSTQAGMPVPNCYHFRIIFQMR